MEGNHVTEAKTSGSVQETELTLIKEAFPNRCRIISDVGEFNKVVTIQPENMDATIKFQLPAAYPSVIPDIGIRSESLTEDNISDLKQDLRSKAKEMVGQQMIKYLITEAEKQLWALGLKPGKTSRVTEQTILGQQQKKNRKQKGKHKSEDDEQNKKLPSMKTADDVVKRIIWDDALEKDDFIVGYFDRFRGLLERCFSDFSWEDLASIDYDVLAIPKHRIQYFKYKNVKVWDKTRRVDNIFGSAEGTKTIDVVMKELEELKGQEQAGIDNISGSKDSTWKTENDYSDEDDSSDDDIQVTIGNTTTPTTKDPTKEKHSYYECRASASYDGDEETAHNNCKLPNQNRLRPNHFLCVRITNEEIIDKIGTLQDHFMDQDPLFSECCIPGAALHITLNTLGLDTPEQVLHCISVLNKMKPVLQSVLPEFSLKLSGISHFHNQVIYVQVHHKQDFQKFCDVLKQKLQEAGVEIRDGYDFVPHVTVMKVSRPITRLRGTRHIDPKLYHGYAGVEFGEQKIDSIFLCAMGSERRDDGFYITPNELHFNV